MGKTETTTTKINTHKHATHREATLPADLWCGLMKSSETAATNSAGMNVRSACLMGQRSRTLKFAVLATVPRIMRITIFTTIPGTVKPCVVDFYFEKKKVNVTKEVKLCSGNLRF